MNRAIACLAAATLSLVAAAVAPAQAAMRSTAPEKMTAPQDEQKMRDCQTQAARQNVPMQQRAKFVMDCMTAKGR
jgi:hypothetical protein